MQARITELLSEFALQLHDLFVELFQNGDDHEATAFKFCLDVRFGDTRRKRRRSGSERETEPEREDVPAGGVFLVFLLGGVPASHAIVSF